jgi:CheY-like chemotaxis protein
LLGYYWELEALQMVQYSVLYVDDEPALLEVGKIFLQRSGALTIETIS